MAARLPGEPQMATDSAVVESNGADPAAAFSRRVVSVSARDAVSDQGEDALTSEVFVTPRVLDQSSFDELGEALRSLIDRASDAGQSLRGQLELAAGVDTRATDASVQLQERLRLGARMIKALQSQIAQVEALLAKAETQPAPAAIVHAAPSLDSANDAIDLIKSFDEKVIAFEARLDDAVRGREKQIDDMIAAATKTIKEKLDEPMTKLAEIDSRMLEIESRIESAGEASIRKLEKYVADRADDLAELDENLIDTAQRVGELSATMERAEVGIAMLEHKRDQALDAINGMTDQAKQAARDATSIIEQCEDARRQLGEDLLGAADRIDEIGRQAKQFTSQVEAKLRKSGKVQETLAEKLKKLTDTIEQAERASKAAERLDGLLARLEPWRTVLLGQTSDSNAENAQTPEPLQRLLEHVQQAVGENMSRLAGAMRTVAECADEIFDSAGEPMEQSDESAPLIETDPPLRLSADG